MNYANFCKTLAAIEANPSGWNQSSLYTCCFGGIAANLAGCGSYDPEERHKAAKEFLGAGAADLFCATRTLDYFRRIRVVAGWAHLAQLRAM